MVVEDNDIFGKIINILKKGKSEDLTISNTVPWKGIVIDMPKRQKGQAHGSNYEILCTENNLWCRVEGDIVADSDSEYETIRNLEKVDCRSFNIHHHNRDDKIDSHIHFMCRSQSREIILKTINSLKDY